MTVAPGFEVKLIASEPMMAQPVCIEFDDRGRLWVVQYLQYPNPAGLKRVKVDRYSRTVYDKVPEPPPLGPKGADRITILEDANQDGVADRAHDFVNGLNLATSVVFGYGGVFVLQAPYLLFYPDRNEDDVPDADPEVLLSGFGIEDAQSFANSLIWGPDGWLYGNQGSTVTAKVRGLEFQQAIWRYHPVTRRFELFCEGGGNNWGLDYDQDGNLFASTNGGGGGGLVAGNPDAPRPFPGTFFNYRMIHMVQGGYYAKSFAKHGELHNPHAYGYFERVPSNNYKGFHVTPGGTIYQGGSFPEEFRGRFIGNDLLGHCVQWSSLEPWGTTFKASYGGDLLIANDTWFAPSDTTTGPDGAIYIADWSDKRMSHPDPDADWDRSNGRVYRIQWRAAAVTSAASTVAAILKGEGPSLTKLPSGRLLELLGHANDWLVRKARRILTERRDATTYAQLRDFVARSRDGQLALEAFWTLYGSGGADEAYLRNQLKHSSPRVRRWAVRFLGDQEKAGAATEAALIAMAEAETDASVRSQLASTAARLSPAAGLRIGQRLTLQNRDREDPYLPLQLWWAIERHSVLAVDAAVELLNTPAVWESPVARDIILPRLVRRYAAEGTGPTLQACAALFAGLPLGGDRGPLIAAFDQGLREQVQALRAPKLDELPATLVKQLTALWQSDTRDERLIRLLSWIGYEPARDRALALAADPKNPPKIRAAMIHIRGDPARPQDIPRFQSWFAGAGPDEIKLAALDALQQFDSEPVAMALLREYAALSTHVRTKVRTSLLSRKSGALALLEHVDSGQMAAQEVPQAEVRSVAQFEDMQLDALVRKHWGKINATPEDKLAVVRRFSNDLSTNRDKPPGDPVRGHQLFLQSCAACHVLFGEGGKIGPDLTAANRKDKDFLLTSIVDPSAVIRKEYLNYNLKTKDGRTITGSVIEESAASITLANVANERTTVARETIASMEDSGISLMPEGLLHPMTPQDRRDLFSYIQGDAPPAKAN